jgi:hypothetical protein
VLVKKQSPAHNDVSTEEEDIVRIRYQATIVEDTADCEHLVRAIGNCKVCRF